MLGLKLIHVSKSGPRSDSVNSISTILYRNLGFKSSKVCFSTFPHLAFMKQSLWKPFSKWAHIMNILRDNSKCLCPHKSLPFSHWLLFSAVAGIYCKLGHQQLWYQLCKIGECLSSTRKIFNYLCHFTVKKSNGIKYKYITRYLCFLIKIQHMKS